MIQQRITLLVGDPGSLEAIRFFNSYSDGISFFYYCCSLLPKPGSCLSTDSSDQNLVFLEFSLFPPHTHTIGFLGRLQSVICLCSLIMWLAEASVLPSHHLEGTLSYATGFVPPRAVLWPTVATEPGSSRWGCVGTAAQTLGSRRRTMKSGKGPETFNFKRHSPETRRTKNPVLWFPFA